MHDSFMRKNGVNMLQAALDARLEIVQPALFLMCSFNPGSFINGLHASLRQRLFNVQEEVTHRLGIVLDLFEEACPDNINDPKCRQTRARALRR